MSLRRGAMYLSVVLAMIAALPAHGETVDPYKIYEQAREYWLTQRYPTQLTYKVAVDVTEGGKERVERYTASYDAVNNIATVDPVSDYELTHPVKPNGVDLGILFWQINKPFPSVDFLGVPRLRPNYSFGMAPFVPAPTPTPFNSAGLVTEIRGEFNDPNPRVMPSPSPPTGPHVIATVVANDRAYTITLLGTETLDGHACYHLALRPTRDPGRYRIREAWIDRDSYAPWQLIDASNFVAGEATRVAWTIRFVDVEGAHYVAQERANAPIARKGEIFSHATISFEGIHPTVQAPRGALIEGSGDFLTEP